jgi:anaphase-promoting complex subunit 3
MQVSQQPVSYTLLEKQLLESVKNSLRYELYSNASFLCERLLAQTDNEDIRLLQAESYLGEGKAYKAYEVLKPSTGPTNRYKFALTCLKLNKLVEAERALLGSTQIRGLASLD